MPMLQEKNSTGLWSRVEKLRSEHVHRLFYSFYNIKICKVMHNIDIYLMYYHYLVILLNVPSDSIADMCITLCVYLISKCAPEGTANVVRMTAWALVKVVINVLLYLHRWIMLQLVLWLKRLHPVPMVGEFFIHLFILILFFYITIQCTSSLVWFPYLNTVYTVNYTSLPHPPIFLHLHTSHLYMSSPQPVGRSSRYSCLSGAEERCS